VGIGVLLAIAAATIDTILVARLLRTLLFVRTLAARERYKSAGRSSGMS
jgi:hypothetical protein